jgi:hypothetical protein
MIRAEFTHGDTQDVPYPHHAPNPEEATQPRHALPSSVAWQPDIPSGSYGDFPTSPCPRQCHIETRRSEYEWRNVAAEDPKHPQPYRPTQSEQYAHLTNKPRYRTCDRREFVIPQVGAFELRVRRSERPSPEIIDYRYPSVIQCATGED